MGPFKFIFGFLFLLLLFYACPRQPVPDQSLEGTGWVLLKYSIEDGILQEPGAERPVTLKFQDDRASGNTGCNSYFAGYEAKSGQLQFDGIGATEKYCEGLMEQEKHYLGLLEGALSYTVRPGQLEIISKNGKLLFEREGGEKEEQGL